jgi:hypothetical protein
MVLTVCE